MAGKKSKTKHKKDKKKEKARRAKPEPKPRATRAHAAKAGPGTKAATRPATGKPAGPATATKGAGGKAGGAAGAGAPAGRPGARPGARPGGSKKGSRRSSLSQRRGPDGELLAPGDLLLPGGASRPEEVQYLFRGSVAAERPVTEEAVHEILIKRGANPETASERPDLQKTVENMRLRFEGGSIEPLLPLRAAIRRNFQGVVERAKHRRREIGAFLRGLDLGHTETSHMDSHGEASLQSLMEWAARLENLTEADEPDHADYNQFHRGLDQLENTTEALIIDVEQTLRRLRDRTRNG
jgi:hypothetical protein